MLAPPESFFRVDVAVVDMSLKCMIEPNCIEVTLMIMWIRPGRNSRGFSFTNCSCDICPILHSFLIQRLGFQVQQNVHFRATKILWGSYSYSVFFCCQSFTALWYTRSIGAPTSSLRPFGPFKCCLRVQRHQQAMCRWMKLPQGLTRWQHCGLPGHVLEILCL